MSTTLPLFWHLSSASKKERIDASVKLVSALEHFQAQFVPKEPETEEDEEQEAEGEQGDQLNALNAQDVSYSIRRLIRGLASPRESSRLGFAVALTELLSRIDTVTCSQIVALILDSSKAQGSMTGQEERDALFARLFGLTSVIQSGLLLRETPLPTFASSSTLASSLSSYEQVITELIALGEKKSFLRESAWWSIGLAVDALGASKISWREDALDWIADTLLVGDKAWTPEKVVLTLKLEHITSSRDWKKLLAPTFKQANILSTANLPMLAKILKEAGGEDVEDADAVNTGSWKPQVHFVWDMLLDEMLPDPKSGRESKGSFPDFFRIVVDESLFSSGSSPERKYWGFQIFQKALPRVNLQDMPMLFTKNFMRSWINHLSSSDRYLHKAAKQITTDIQSFVKSNPTIGFTLILQLTGVHGSRQFDKLTKTKTVGSILTSMDNDGIQSYIDYLLQQVDEKQDVDTVDIEALNARRAWIIDQLPALIRNGAIPKSDAWIQAILDWLTVHGLFIVTKKSDRSTFRALHNVPTPTFSDELRKSCRDRLLSCLAELTSQSTVVKADEKTTKEVAVASNGEFWVSRVLSTINQLEQDAKHVKSLSEVDEEEQELRSKARSLIARLETVPDDRREAARGAGLLLSATLLHHYCVEDEDADTDTLEACIDGVARMFPEDVKRKKKSRKSETQNADVAGETPEPVDILVDTVIGFLEKATAYMRSVANQVFSLLSGSVTKSTIDLILTQLERRDPTELVADEDEEMDEDDEEGSDDVGHDNEESSEDEDEDEEDEEEMDEAEAEEVRRKIEEALRVNGIHAATGDSDEESEEELMDDDQMLAIDEQLAAAFKSQTGEKRSAQVVSAQREATHFKNRVLDLLEVLIKRHPSSPLVIRLILPLVELIVTSSSDEKHLSDKATGLLRSRLCKSKDIVSISDKEQATDVMQELHVSARKCSSTDVLTTLSQSCLYLSRSMLHVGMTEQVLKVYRESLSDFVTRKASKLNGAFFQDFMRRYPDAGWVLRDDLVALLDKAVNTYRQLQVYQILQVLINQLAAESIRRAEVTAFIAFMKTLRKSIQGIVAGACDDNPAWTAAQLKELFKVALSAVRQTKRFVADVDEISTVWDPSSWTALADKLAASSVLKTSTGLQNSCKQIASLAVKSAPTSDEKAQTGKRKADSSDAEEQIVQPQKKPKRVKIKKVKS